MTDIRNLLSRHVSDVEGLPVEWGVNDCTMWAVEWFERVKGYELDLAPYASREEAYELIDNAGGLNELWGSALVGHLERRYVDPQFGDVGVIRSRLFGQVGGIFGDDGVFFWRSDKGTALLRPRPSTIISVWAID